MTPRQRELVRASHHASGVASNNKNSVVIAASCSVSKMAAPLSALGVMAARNRNVG